MNSESDVQLARPTHLLLQRRASEHLYKLHTILLFVVSHLHKFCESFMHGNSLTVRTEKKLYMDQAPILDLDRDYKAVKESE